MGRDSRVDVSNKQQSTKVVTPHATMTEPTSHITRHTPYPYPCLYPYPYPNPNPNPNPKPKLNLNYKIKISHNSFPQSLLAKIFPPPHSLHPTPNCRSISLSLSLGPSPKPLSRSGDSSAPPTRSHQVFISFPSDSCFNFG